MSNLIKLEMIDILYHLFYLLERILMIKKQDSNNAKNEQNTKSVDFKNDDLKNESLQLPLTTKPYAVFVENFTLAQSTEPLHIISSDGARTMKALEHIDDKSFTIAPYLENKIQGNYPEDFKNLVINAYNNQHYADWLVHINKNTELVVVGCNQLDCHKHKGPYGALTIYNALAQVDVMFFDEELNSNIKNYQTIVDTLAKQVRNKIWGHLSCTIHPVKDKSQFVARLVLGGRGVNIKAALEIWAKSAEKIKF